MSSAATQTRSTRPSNIIRRPRGRGEETMAYLPYLRRWRLAARLTQQQLCAASHVTLSTISRLERRPMEQPCRLGLVHRLASALGVSNFTLIEQEPPEQLPDNWALGHVVRLTEEDGELRFRLPLLWLFMDREGEMTADELSARSGIDADDLEEMRLSRIGATSAQLQHIAAALGMRQMDLITRIV